MRYPDRVVAVEVVADHDRDYTPSRMRCTTQQELGFRSIGTSRDMDGPTQPQSQNQTMSNETCLVLLLGSATREVRRKETRYRTLKRAGTLIGLGGFAAAMLDGFRNRLSAS